MLYAPNHGDRILQPGQHTKVDWLHTFPESWILHRQHGCSTPFNSHMCSLRTDRAARNIMVVSVSMAVVTPYQVTVRSMLYTLGMQHATSQCATAYQPIAQPCVPDSIKSVNSQHACFNLVLPNLCLHFVHHEN